jgi:hypothetical protein
MLYDKGKSKGSGDGKFLSGSYYDLGLAMYSALFEGVRLATRISPRRSPPRRFARASRA